MRRRDFIKVVAVSVVTWPPAARAQRARIAKIGFLSSATATGYAKKFEALQTGLRDFGYLEGKNIVIHSRWAEGNYNQLAALASELVALKVDVLVTHGTPATGALKKATATIPIVKAVSGDAEKTGLIQTLARPGGNVTGLTYFAAEQASKRLEVMKEVIPSINRVAWLTNPENPAMRRLELPGVEDAVRSLKITYKTFEVRDPAELDNVFSTIAKGNFDMVEIAQDGMLVGNFSRIATLALKEHLPAIGEVLFADEGGLVDFGPNTTDMFRRAAYYVDRLLKGEKAADLPVERPTKYELNINLKTAKALGISVPGTVLARADNVIE
jgi:putative tryptophan/tyrosine transport system substrate-binding protein